MKTTSIAGLARLPLAPLAVLALLSMPQPAAAQTAGEEVVIEEAPAAKPVKAKKPAAQAASAQTIADLVARVTQLEQQIVDMQVATGTLESLARGGAKAGSASAVPDDIAGGDLGMRMRSVETQIQALSVQLQDLSAQLQGGRTALRPSAPDPQGDAFQPSTAAASVPAAPTTAGLEPLAPLGDQSEPLFGEPAGGASAAQPAATDDLAALSGAGTPAEDYEAAYAALLKQDYPAAQSGFQQFVAVNGKDPLAGNAYYWLGESHYVQGQYKEAADAYLLGFNGYKKGQKAPDNLLKLAMSLSRLGQKDAACSAFTAFGGQFPNAPQQLKKRADAERQRTGC